MRAVAPALLIAAATASVLPQQITFQLPKQISTLSWDKPLQQIKHSLKSVTGEARKIWDEVAMMFPEEMDQLTFFSAPKPNIRGSDSKWDYVMRGADIQNVWVTNSNGEKQREIDGHLDIYNLRTKKVDPKSLGVDKVKQYSGYLDNEEDDKHLFYCRSPSRSPI